MKNRRLKNIFKTATAVLIISALLLSVGCEGGNGGGTEPPDSSESVPGGVIEDPSEHRHPGVYTRAGELTKDAILDEVFDPDFKITEPLRWLSWFEVDNYSPAMEVMRARFGEPDGKAPVVRVVTGYETRYDILQTQITAGDSPDIFQFEERFFPYGAHAGLYLPVDDLIDFSRPEWDATRDIMSLFEWGGRNFTAITELNNSTALLFYRNSVAQQAGLEDPFDLWEAGLWDWDTLLDMVSHFSVKDEKWGIKGFYIDEAAILSTGIGLLSIEDGLLKDNMYDNRIERAMDMLYTIARGDFRYPYHLLSDFQPRYTEFRSGDILFWNDGPWAYQEYFTKFRAADNWADDEFRIVPFPKDPNANEHFMRGKQDAMMLVKGSTNHEAFRAYTYSLLLAHQDEEMIEVTRGRLKDLYAWTDHHLDVLERLSDPSIYTLVWDFKNGIGIDLSCAVTGSAIQEITRPVIVEGEYTYAHLREEHRPRVVERIYDVMNGRSQNWIDNGWRAQ
ncbi:MAG: ABC transporter substrate-binding protein [Oscillospiraceae bacterium]|nr:ABC transporter substrate-binding protein [Oscillospiraceae bacterium]